MNKAKDKAKEKESTFENSYYVAEARERENEKEKEKEKESVVLNDSLDLIYNFCWSDAVSLLSTLNYSVGTILRMLEERIIENEIDMVVSAEEWYTLGVDIKRKWSEQLLCSRGVIK